MDPPTSRNHMVSNPVSVEAMQNNVIGPFVTNPAFGYSDVQLIKYVVMPVRQCTILLPNEVIWFVFLKVIEEIVIVVEHQDRKYQLQLLLQRKKAHTLSAEI